MKRFSAAPGTALPGWPCGAGMEWLRDAFVAATSGAQRAEAVQADHRWTTETAPQVTFGPFALARGYSARLQGILDAPVPVYWNISKTAQ